MPHSLRAKLSGLRYKGILEDKDYKRLCKALDNEDVLEQIRAEIKAEMKEYRDIDDFSKSVGYGLRSVIGIIERKTNDL